MNDHAKRVAKEFAKVYYDKLIYEPSLLHMFYADESSLVVNGSAPVNGPGNIQKAYVSLGFNSMERLHSLSGTIAPNKAVLVVVDGTFTFTGMTEERRLSHIFILAKKANGASGYDVTNDVITIVDDGAQFVLSGQPLNAEVPILMAEEQVEINSCAKETNQDGDDLENQRDENSNLNFSVRKDVETEQMAETVEVVAEKELPSAFSYAAITKKSTEGNFVTPVENGGSTAKSAIFRDSNVSSSNSDQPQSATGVPLKKSTGGGRSNRHNIRGSGGNASSGVTSSPKVAPGCALCVKGIKKEWSNKDFADFFSVFGKVMSVDINDDKWLAYVNFSTPESLKNVMAARPIVMENKTLIVEERGSTWSKSGKGAFRAGVGRSRGMSGSNTDMFGGNHPEGNGGEQRSRRGRPNRIRGSAGIATEKK